MDFRLSLNPQKTKKAQQVSLSICHSPASLGFSISRESIWMPIDIKSREYKFWRKAGYALVCLLRDGKLKLMEIVKTSTNSF